MIRINRRGTGTLFCLMSAFLFSVRYIRTEMSDIYNADFLTIASLISLIIGVIYLIVAEINNR